MTVRQKICSRIRRYDASFSSVLLLMILSALGCNTQGSNSDDKKDTDKSANSGDKAQRTESGRADPSAQKMTGASAKSTPAPHASGETKPPMRIVSSDRSASFLVGVSLPGALDDQHHVRELMINPYYNELFSCSRSYNIEADDHIYHAHFAIKDGRQILFKQLNTNSRTTKTKSPSGAAANTKAGRCLLELYQHSIIELSGIVPVSEFTLSFDFKQ